MSSTGTKPYASFFSGVYTLGDLGARGDFRGERGDVYCFARVGYLVISAIILFFLSLSNLFLLDSKMKMLNKAYFALKLSF